MGNDFKALTRDYVLERFGVSNYYTTSHFLCVDILEPHAQRLQLVAIISQVLIGTLKQVVASEANAYAYDSCPP